MLDRTALLDTSRQGVAFQVFSHRWNQRSGLLDAGRRIALRHDDLVAIGGRRRDQRRRQIATAWARSSPGYDVIHTGRGLHGSRRRCTTCRGKHHRRCGGYQKIQVPHITNVATCTSRASGDAHDAYRHFSRAAGQFESTRRSRAYVPWRTRESHHADTLNAQRGGDHWT